MPIQKKLRFAGIGDEEDAVSPETYASDLPDLVPFEVPCTTPPTAMSPTDHGSAFSENTANAVDINQAFNTFEGMSISDTKAAKVSSPQVVSGVSEQDIPTCTSAKAKLEPPTFKDVHLDSSSERKWEIDMLGGRKSVEFAVSKDGSDLGIQVCSKPYLLTAKS